MKEFKGALKRGLHCLLFWRDVSRCARQHRPVCRQDDELLHQGLDRRLSSCLHLVFSFAFADVEPTHALDYALSNTLAGALIHSHFTGIRVEMLAARDAVANASLASDVQTHDAPDKSTCLV